MSYQDLQDHLQTFSELINHLQESGDEKINRLIHYYVEQNVTLLNDIFLISIKHLTMLQKSHSANDIICAQARLTHEMNQKLSLSTQRFLNVSLGQIADHNDWLKAHCDLATD